MTGGDVIADEDIGGVKHQKVKLEFGAAGTATLVTAAVGLPISQLDANNTGTISATDALGGVPGGAGVVISTAPTAASFVAAAVPGGSAQADIQIKGTATGTYYFEGSMDSTNGSDGTWIAVNYRQTGITNTVLGYSTTAVGVYRGAPSGFSWIRVRNVGGTTPSNAVIIRYSGGSGTTFLNASIPAGTNTVGTMLVHGSSPPGQSLAVAAATPITGAGLDASLAGNVTFIVKNTVAGTPITGTPVIVFEQSDDNVSWSPLLVVRSDTGVVGSTVTIAAASLAANSELMFDAGMEGVNWVRARVTTAQVTNGMTIITDLGGMPFSPAVSVLAGAALTKGTQGAVGFMTQELRDSGRNVSNLFMAAPIITTVAEVMMSLTGYKSGAAITATATPAVVTAGKTLRIERVTITYIAATVIGSMKVNLRALSSGVALIGSPLAMTWQVGMAAAFTAGAADTYVFDYPEGLEFAAGYGVAISIQGFGAVPTTGTIVGYGMVAIEGYEY